MIPLSGAWQTPTDTPRMPPPREQKADAGDCREQPCWASWRQVGIGRWVLSLLPGSDKEAILELITSRSNRQRQEICQSYKSLYGKVTMATRRQGRWGQGMVYSPVCSFRVFPECFTPDQPLCWHFALFPSVRGPFSHKSPTAPAVCWVLGLHR